MSARNDPLDAAPPPRQPARAPHWLPVRNMGARHEQRVVAHLQKLGDEDRHLRFGQVATDEQIAHYVRHIHFERDKLFGIFDTRLQLVAMAHLAFSEDGQQTEFGVSVLAHQRGRGFGARLFEHAVVHARNRGARSMTIHLARENQAMLAIVRQSGAAMRFEGSDVVADLSLPEDTLGTHVGALLESQVAEWDYRLKTQALRLDRFWHRWMPDTLR
jgi:ribosomal protein S18 acetylase RimI-like enzyme